MNRSFLHLSWYCFFRVFPISLLCFAVSCQQNFNDSPISGLRIDQSKDGQIALGQPGLLKADIALDKAIDFISFELKNSEGMLIEMDWPCIADVKGQQNYTLSQQFQVPTTVRSGKYWLILSVEDVQSLEHRDSILIDVVLDNTIPIIGALDVGINKKGNDLHLEAELTAISKIDRVEVLIEGEHFSKDVSFDKPSIKDQLTITFHEHVHVDDAPAGEYTVLLTLYDQEGRIAKAEGAFTK